MKALIKTVIKKSICTAFLPVLIMGIVISASPCKCYADETLLSNYTYELLFQEELNSANAMVQSICADEDYIYTIVNSADDASVPDTINAYYKNSSDENGNPVQQYSLARSDSTQHLEHGNGLTYNPQSDELIMAPYTHMDPENRGCLIIIDPDSLQIKKKVKVTDSFNFLSIAYDRKKNIYYSQANADAQYSNYILDSSFNIIEEMGPVDPTPGYNFQAFCLAGDYLIQSPLTIFLSSQNYLMAYSTKSRTVVDYVTANFDLEGFNHTEPEQISRLDDDSFILVVNYSKADQNRLSQYYRISFPNLPLNDTMFENESAPDDNSSAQLTAPADDDSNQTASESNNTNKEVSISKVQDILIGSDPKTITQTNKLPLLTIILPIAAAVVFGWYINIVRIRRARKRRDNRLRKLRRRLEEDIDRQLSELNFYDDDDLL